VVKTYRLVSCLCFLVAIVVFLHHKVISGKWFDPEDFLHHEVVIVGFAMFGFGLLARGLLPEE
jgi:hypothetical protein